MNYKEQAIKRLELLINSCPTSKLREELTEINILLQANDNAPECYKIIGTADEFLEKFMHNGEYISEDYHKGYIGAIEEYKNYLREK